MDRPKIVITNRIHDDVVALLESHCAVVANFQDQPWTCKELLGHARDAVGIMAFMTDCIDREFLRCCPDLRIVAGVLKGFDNFDVDACTASGVWLTVVPDRLTPSTAELAIGLLIGVSRHVVVGDAYVRRDYQGWKPIFYGKGLHESTVGILGMGALGQAVAARLKPFGCQILYFDEQPLSPREASILGARFMYFDELMRTSDFVLIALPLNCRTKHLINRDVLSRMKHDCYLINTARGSIVDEEAVADAIGEGRLGGYAADVFEMEDLARKDRPQSISPRLLSNRARTVLTPHLGSAEHRVRRAAEAEMAHSILDYLNGRLPRGAVNRPGIKQASKAC